MKQFLFFIRKEFLHLWRDKRTMFILFGMPIVQIFIFGFALTNEVKDSRIAILDDAKDEASEAIIHQLEASLYFDVEKNISQQQLVQAFKEGKIKLAVVFPQRFNEDLQHTNTASI